MEEHDAVSTALRAVGCPRYEAGGSGLETYGADLTVRRQRGPRWLEANSESKQTRR